VLCDNTYPSFKYITILDSDGTIDYQPNFYLHIYPHSNITFKMPFIDSNIKEAISYYEDVNKYKVDALSFSIHSNNAINYDLDGAVVKRKIFNSTINQNEIIYDYIYDVNKLYTNTIKLDNNTFGAMFRDI